MRQLFFTTIISILFLASTTVKIHAQYKYDIQKVSSIRWSPNPVSTKSTVSKATIDLNGTWNFHSTPDESFWKKDASAGWNSIDVPGEWVMQGFEVKSGEYAAYKKTFTLPESWNNKRVKLKCEAIYSECKIWVNEKYVGWHLGGFTPFEFDISNYVDKKDNKISIAVRSESLADTLSNGSAYAVHPLGGISRPIYLLALPETNIASFHVSTLFDKDYQNATLKAELTLANESKSSVTSKIEFTLKDMEGNLVRLEGNNELKVHTKPGDKQKKTVDFGVVKPKKWNPEEPNLYYINLKLYEKGRLTETITRKFGFRQIEVRGNQVFVNNKPIKLKGVCRHEVDPLRGRSLKDSIWEKDIKLFKKANVNYIRTSHYPPSEKLLEACDEIGMFVEEEAPFCWAHKGPVNNENYFDAILRPTLEMLERDRSHPSILLWSLANESEDFIQLYKSSADLIKQIDPTRPRVFSAYFQNNDSGYLEIGNIHYPGPYRPKKNSIQKRPIVFDEYCHLNAYNRFELMTDPGLRDFWGESFYLMWEKMYNSQVILGGALWAGIDDSFFLPSGHTVGYGTWGPIDGWRREKPEYWHMKKIYSPVKVKLLSSGSDTELKLLIENRFFFTNLTNYVINWKTDKSNGVLRPDINPGEKDTIILPFSKIEERFLSLDVYDPLAKYQIDSYHFPFCANKGTVIETTKNKFKWTKSQTQFKASSSDFSLTIDLGRADMKIIDNEGIVFLSGFPELMILPLNGEGRGIQMTKETPSFYIYSSTCSNRMIQNLEVKPSTKEIIIRFTDTYDEAGGYMEMRIEPDGKIGVEYEYELFKEVHPRQTGLSVKLAREMENLWWKRKGLWTVYPEDHIGRLDGRAKLFNDLSMVGLAGPDKKPTWAWNNDQTKFGSNDFRSSKRNIHRVELTDKNNKGIVVISPGLHHTRCWLENKSIYLLIANYDNLGAERFLQSHGKLRSKVLKPGNRIKDKITLYIKK